MSKVLKDLEEFGYFINKKELIKLKPDEMSTELSAAYASGKLVTVVDDFTTFFSVAELRLAVLRGPIERLRLLSKYHNVHLGDDDIETATNFWELCASVDKALVGIAADWEFADVPVDWDIDKNLKITDRLIKRDHHTIGVKTLQKLWTEYAKWLVGSRHTDLSGVRASGYPTKWPTPYKDYIDVGCQRIKRYEIEQVALRFGWDFPEKVV